MKLDQVCEVRKWGNSGGVLVPKEWLGKQVKIVLVDRSLEIRKEVLKILDNYLDDIIGIYLVGSYARGEQSKDSDIDILVISKDIKKTIKSGNYEVEIIPKRVLFKILESNSPIIYPKIIDAKVILNKDLINEIRNLKLTKESMMGYLENCLDILKTNKEIIDMDKLEGNELESIVVVYSLILRLRTLNMMREIIKGNSYTNKGFEKWLKNKLNIDEKECSNIIKIYKEFRDDVKTKKMISITLVEKMMDLLHSEVNVIKNGK